MTKIASEENFLLLHTSQLYLYRPSVYAYILVVVTLETVLFNNLNYFIK